MTIAQRTHAALAFLASARSATPAVPTAAGVRGTRQGWAVRFAVAARAIRPLARPT